MVEKKKSNQTNKAMTYNFIMQKMTYKGISVFNELGLLGYLMYLKNIRSKIEHQE